MLGMPRMLRDLLGGIVGPEPDMEIVGEAEDEGDVPAAIGRTGAEFLIVGLNGSDLPPVSAPVLFQRPDVTVFGLSTEGRQGYLYELRPHAVPVGEVSPGLLLDIIRRAATGELGLEPPIAN